MTLIDRGLSRRTVLKAFGVTAAAGVLTGANLGTTWAGTATVQPVTFSQWVASRGSQYYVAHRGSGDVLPEHSLPAYRAAAGWGAPVLEISVNITSDGVLICLHDPTYDRTTTASGPVIAQPSSILADTRIWQPQLGAYWTENAPSIPLFEDVLKTFGRTRVLAVEAKVDAAYKPMIALIQKYGLQDSVIVKSHFSSGRWASAQLAGYPIFCYFGSAAEISVPAILAVATDLDPDRDCLVIPAYSAGAGPFLSDLLVEAAVATGVPVWVFPVHRRSDAAHFFDRGVSGVVSASYGYVAGEVPQVITDSWATQAIASGEISKDPSSLAYAPVYTPDGAMVLAAKGTQHFMTMGQFAPLVNADSSYVIDVDVSWQALPASTADNITVAFGRSDDSYYQHRQGRGTGYHAILRANGELGLYRHNNGQVAGVALAPPVQTGALARGAWAHLQITVDGDDITVARTDVKASVTASDSAVRGGYLHLGRSSLDGSAAFRNLSIG